MMNARRTLSPAALAAALLLAALMAAPARAQTASTTTEDFESYSAGDMPGQWFHITRGEEALPISEVTGPSETATVRSEQGNQFLRLRTENEALRITQRNGKEFNWNLQEQPYLRWEWRANQLPEGASEKGDNDTGGAVYVTYGSDWLGRPKSIKYTYSSTLPVGTTVGFGPLTAIVVASGAEGTGQWQTETRNVAQDIRNAAGDDVPNEPLSITLWSDSDTTGGTAEVDFDDIRLLSQP